MKITCLAVVVAAALAVESAWAERDVSALRATEIVTPEDAAKIIGGTLLTPPIGGYPHCMYVVEMPDGITESYTLAFASASAHEAYVEFLAKEDKNEKVPGPWDEAWLCPREMGAGFDLVVLKRGDIALNVGGERKEPLIALAKIAVERLK